MMIWKKKIYSIYHQLMDNHGYMDIMYKSSYG